MRKTKFQIGDILPIALTLVVAGIAIAFGLNVQEDIGTDIWETDCVSPNYWNSTSEACQLNSTDTTAVYPSNAYNASGEGVDAVSTLAEKLPLIATVVAAAIIIGVLLRFFMNR